jgi:hypothetical protein
MSRESLRDFVAHHDERWLFVALYIGLAVVLSIVLSLFWLVAVAGLHFALECARQAMHRQSRSDVVSHALWEIKLDIALVLIALALSLYMEVFLGILGVQSAARATAASRIGIRAARAAAWQRTIRGAVLIADDIVVAATRLMRRGPKGEAARAAAGGLVLAQAAEPRARATAGNAAAPVASSAASAALPAPAAASAAPATTSAAPAAASAASAAPAAVPPEPPSWRGAWSFGDRLTLAALGASLLIIMLAPLLTEHSWTGAIAALMEELQPFPSR